VDPDLVQEFPGAFMRSGRESIDEFVESRPKFLPLAKLAIAFVLGPLENEAALYPRGAIDHDWMRYLLNRMLHGNVDEFRENKLKVITFNFDCSFERKLFSTVRSAFGVARESALNLCEQTVPVLHIHDDLGQVGWGERQTEGS